VKAFDCEMQREDVVLHMRVRSPLRSRTEE